jgi:glycerol-3-phosphate dehydrogenase (NAD(P)+)
MQFGIIGSGSWATALAKILTDNRHSIHWWIRNSDTIRYMQQRKHNPHYLSAAYFDTRLLQLNADISEVVAQCDVVIVAVPAAYASAALSTLSPGAFKGKKIVSAIKGILPESNQLLHEYLADRFQVPLQDYFAVLGPCHAEEVAAEKLSYLTFSGVDEATAAAIAGYFKGHYLNIVVNHDIIGVQYAAVLKNIYALGAGIAHGLEYGDNFLSVYIANAAHEMAHFLQKAMQLHPQNGSSEKNINYNSSVYLGDLLVTCYSLFSRNRMFGNMIGKGYSVKAAILELNMVAEGYNASRCMHQTNQAIQAGMPVATEIYKILWEQLPAAEGFKNIENLLV